MRVNDVVLRGSLCPCINRSAQAIDDDTAPALHEFKEAAESEEEEFREHEKNLQVGHFTVPFSCRSDFA